MNKILKIILIILIFIIGVNSLFWILVEFNVYPISDLYKNGLIIGFPYFHYAMVFAHGSYHEYNKTLIVHQTYYKGVSISTRYLLDRLHEQGYNKVWISMCQTGNHPYMIYNLKTKEKILWYDWVSRNKNPGTTIPIFIGLGFIRL